MEILLYLLWLLSVVYLLVIGVWTTGALYFDAGHRGLAGWLWLITWVVVVVATLTFVQPYWLAVVVITILFVCVLAWWLSLKPSHHRAWDPNFSELPRIVLEGDLIQVQNVRNTRYRSLQDYDVRYEDREYRLSNLRGVDGLILYWGSNLMSHPMVIFDFGDDGHLCFSIEVRYRANGKYELIPSLYRQNELMYVVSDERDAILRRSKYSANHDCYLYRMQTQDIHNIELLMDYIDQVNQIFDQPRWYNAVAANCTTSIYRQRNEHSNWDWRILFNGAMDRMLYEWGRFYQGMPFDELKQKSWINDRANSADENNFSETIRSGLPGF